MIVALAVAMVNPQPAAAAKDDQIAKIESSGKLRVCYAEDNPWTFKNPATGNWEGFTRDLAADFAAALGVELVDVDATWKTIIQSVKNDECDIAGAALFANVKRAKVTLFSVPYALATSSAIVHKDSDLKLYSDLDQAGKVIVVKAGTATEDFSKRFFKKAEVKPFVSDTDAVLFAEVASKRADPYWSTHTKATIFLQKNKQFPVRPLGDQPVDETYIIWAVDAGEYAFQQVMNVWLTRHIAAGKTAALWEKWFDSAYVR